MSDRDTAHQHLTEAIALLNEADKYLDLDDTPYPRNAYWKGLTHQAEDHLKLARKVMSV